MEQAYTHLSRDQYCETSPTFAGLVGFGGALAAAKRYPASLQLTLTVCGFSE